MKNNKLLVVIILIVILCIGLGVYFLFKKNQTKNENITKSQIQGESEFQNQSSNENLNENKKSNENENQNPDENRSKNLNENLNENKSENEDNSSLNNITENSEQKMNDESPKTEELASFSTKIYTKEPERQNNVKLTCSALNGTIVKNSNTFSFCNTLGPATPKKGYQKADTFDDKR